MAIAILNQEKYQRAEIIAKAEDKDVFEVYKSLGASFVEGTNEEIEGMKKYTAIYDEKKKKAAKKPKKLGAIKKKK